MPSVLDCILNPSNLSLTSTSPLSLSSTSHSTSAGNVRRGCPPLSSREAACMRVCQQCEGLHILRRLSKNSLREKLLVSFYRSSITRVLHLSVECPLLGSRRRSSESHHSRTENDQLSSTLHGRCFQL